MGSVFQDARFAVRYLARRRVFAALAIAMLTLGIGATVAMFSVVDGVLLRALPYPAAGRLVSIWQTFPHWRGQPVLDAQWDRIALSYEDYGRVSALDHDFEGVAAAYWRQGVRLTGGGDSVEVSVARGSASLLPLLGIHTLLGRWFIPGEEGLNAPHLAVIPHAIWQGRFGGDPGVIGKALTLNDQQFIIIGVLPADFPFTSISPFGRDADRAAIWTPIGSWSGDLTANSQNYEVIARLRPESVLSAVRDEVAATIRAGRNPAQHDARILLRQDAETRGVKTPLTILFIAVFLLLVIACGNLAALHLGEAATRESEIQTRLAIGARPGDIVRQLLTESAVLAFVAAALGIPLATVLTRSLLALAPTTLPRADFVAFDWRAAAFSLVMAMGATFAFGLSPALSLARTRTGVSAAGSRAVSRRGRVQHFLLAAQIALSTVLLVAAGLLIRTLMAEQAMYPGFDSEGLLTVSLNASTHARNSNDPAEVQRFYDDVIAKIAGLRGVQSVTATTNVPIAGSGGQWAMNPDPAGKLTLASPSVQHDEVLPNFFSVMRIPLLAGRMLSDDDRTGRSLAAVVNEVMARQFWPRESAVGKSFLAPNGGVRTVVGIVADIQERGYRQPPAPTFYESVRQLPQSRLTLIVRTNLSPDILAAPVRQAIASVDRALPTPPAVSMDSIIRAAMAPERYRAILVGFFAGVAIVMTAIGIAGVAARAMRSQMRELCIRMAIGATARDIVSYIVLQYTLVAGIGLAAGGVAAVLTMRFAQGYLVGITPRDPLTYILSGILLLTSSTLAGWTAARRLYRVRIVDEIAG